MNSSSWYRRRCWFMKGKREYTRSGFENARQKFNNADLDVDCSHRHFLITGANSGIGLQTALDIARKGGVLHLLCRNRSSMAEARSRIITTTGNDRIHMHTLDLSRPRDVGRWAQDFLTSHDKLDVIIHAAETISSERIVDDDGIELTFAVHCLSLHILTLTLLPLLQRSDDARVITISSPCMLTVKLDPLDLLFENIGAYESEVAYSQTKREQVVLNLLYAQMYENVKFYCTHPGWSDTPFFKKTSPQIYEEMKDNLRTIEQGADTTVWLAVSLAALKYSSGLFFQDRSPCSTHLPLAWTKSAFQDEQLFLKKINCLLQRVSQTEQTSAVNNATYGYSNFVQTRKRTSIRMNKAENDELLEGESRDGILERKEDVAKVESSSISEESQNAEARLEEESVEEAPYQTDFHSMEQFIPSPYLDDREPMPIDPDHLECIPEVPENETPDYHNYRKMEETLHSRLRPVIIDKTDLENKRISEDVLRSTETLNKLIKNDEIDHSNRDKHDNFDLHDPHSTLTSLQENVESDMGQSKQNTRQ